MFLLWFCVVCSVLHTQWKVSKAMKNVLNLEEEIFAEEEKLKSEYEKREEHELKMKNIKMKSFQELRNIFHPIYKAEYKESHNRHQPLQCSSQEQLWVRLQWLTIIIIKIKSA